MDVKNRVKGLGPSRCTFVQLILNVSAEDSRAREEGRVSYLRKRGGVWLL